MRISQIIKIASILTLIIAISCTEKNELPSGKIIAPTSLDTIQQGDTIHIEVDAFDSDGLVSSVVVYLNSVELDELFEAPYKMDFIITENHIGVYNLRAMVWDDQDDATELSEEITVITSQKPKVSLIVEGRAYKVEEEVHFIDNSTGNPTRWYWDFGDGNSSSLANPTHSYSEPGTYTVALTCWNEYGPTKKEYEGLMNIGGEDDVIDKRNDKVYKTTKIGNQIWMAENLDYIAPNGTGYYWRPKNPEFDCMYTWKTALEVCPSGWKLPSNDDWEELELYLENSEPLNVGVGSKLKSTSGWEWDSAGINGTNESGFNALPGGFYHPWGGGSFENVRTQAYFWTASKLASDTTRLTMKVLWAGGSALTSRSWTNDGYACNVRCIKE